MLILANNNISQNRKAIAILFSIVSQAPQKIFLLYLNEGCIIIRKKMLTTLNGIAQEPVVILSSDIRENTEDRGIGGGQTLSKLFGRNIHIWLPGYLLQGIKPKPRSGKLQHIIFAIVDHFEPIWNHATQDQERWRMNSWIEGYPETVKGHRDADGINPRHTWFYPYDEFRDWQMEQLADLCSKGYGEIELHLHHDNDTSETLRQKIEEAKRVFSKYGALPAIPSGLSYGFIHGNWSLDNSRRDGRWCGVNNELQVLRDTGCYADFTMPSAPSDTQSRKINSIYYAKDDPNKPKSFNTGRDVKINKASSGDLMLIQGPLCLNWKMRKAFILPKIENGEVASHNPPVPKRIDLWIRSHIHVKGLREWTFVKVYTHGAQDRNCEALLGTGGLLDRMYSYLEEKYNDGVEYKLHYATAREMFNIIKAAESGKYGDPNSYRDFILLPPSYALR